MGGCQYLRGEGTREEQSSTHLVVISLLSNKLLEPSEGILLGLTALLLEVEGDDALESLGLEVRRKLGGILLGGGEEALQIGDAALAQRRAEVLDGLGGDVRLAEEGEEGDGRACDGGRETSQPSCCDCREEAPGSAPSLTR